MLDIDQIKEEIQNLENGRTTFANCEKLAALYIVCDHRGNTPLHAEKSMKGREHPEKLDLDTALGWVSKMENADGTTGGHWSMEQARQAMAQRDIKADPVEFYAVLNMMYSDYCAVVKKYGVNQLDFYADLALAWIDDKDAKSGKTALYYVTISGK